MNKAKAKLIIAALIFAMLVIGGVYFVNNRGLVTSSAENEKQFEFVYPTEPVYAEEKEAIDDFYVQPSQIWISSIPNARLYSDFCDENFEGRYVILDQKSEFRDFVKGTEYSIRCVERSEFKAFFEDNITITTPENGEIFEEAEMVPLLTLSCMTRKEGTVNEDSPLIGNRQLTNVLHDLAMYYDDDGNIANPDVDGSEKYLSGIDVTFGDTAEYRKHFKDNKLDIVFSDAQVVRLVVSKDLLNESFGGGGSFIAIVDATVSCNENNGLYKDISWIPEAGHQNRARFMMTCFFDIRALENEPITDHLNWMTSFGVYGYEPLN